MGSGVGKISGNTWCKSLKRRTGDRLYKGQATELALNSVKSRRKKYREM